MKTKLQKMRTVQMTYLYLSVPDNLEKFLCEFRQILKDSFQVITVEGEKRYTCGQEHTRSNPSQEPFKYFESYCLKQGLYDFEVRDFLEEYLGRPIVCECDIWADRKSLRKRDLARMYGLDFEGYEFVG